MDRSDNLTVHGVGDRDTDPLYWARLEPPVTEGAEGGVVQQRIPGALRHVGVSYVAGERFDFQDGNAAPDHVLATRFVGIVRARRRDGSGGLLSRAVVP